MPGASAWRPRVRGPIPGFSDTIQDSGLDLRGCSALEVENARIRSARIRGSRAVDFLVLGPARPIGVGVPADIEAWLVSGFRLGVRQRVEQRTGRGEER